MVRSVIAGIGSYVPPEVVTNDDLSKLMDTSDEWIRSRSGIEERHHAPEGVSCSDLALEASRKALEDAGMSPSDLDFIIFATLSPDQNFPGNGCYLQAELGAGPIGAMDVRTQCSGFLYALTTADAFIRAGIYRNILVVGAELQSSILDFSNRGRNVTVLFGDGAAATVVSASEDPERGILYSELHADGTFASCLQMRVWDISRKPYISRDIFKSGAMWMEMDGPAVFKHAVMSMTEVADNSIKRSGIKAEDIKYVIPHQANQRINLMVAERLGFPPEKFLSNIRKYGNTSAASIPLLMDQTYRSGMLERGDLLLLLGFGSGFTWASTLLRW